jgi:transposase, IS6 family
MTRSSLFTWRSCQPEIILCGVRGYQRDARCDRDVEAGILARGISVDHPTGCRWVPCDAPERDQRRRSHLKTTQDSYGVDG